MTPTFKRCDPDVRLKSCPDAGRWPQRFDAPAVCLGLRSIRGASLGGIRRVALISPLEVAYGLAR